MSFSFLRKSEPQGRPTTYDDLLGAVILTGKAKTAAMTTRFFGVQPAGPMETAGVLERDAELASRMLRVANTVQHGAGIPVTNLSAAAVRLGPERMQSIALAFELSRAVISATDSAPGDCWAGALARASFARALAMPTDRRLGGTAFLIGYLQDVAKPILAAAFPEEYSRLYDESEGNPLRFAALKYHVIGLNHIHAAMSLLTGCRLPRQILDAIGRHHTNPPMIPATDHPLRLWQIGYIAGLLPFGGEAVDEVSAGVSRRYLAATMNLSGDGLSRLLSAAREEFIDVADLFAEFMPCDCVAAEIFRPTALALGVTVDAAAADRHPVPGDVRPSLGFSREELNTPVSVQAR